MEIGLLFFTAFEARTCGRSMCEVFLKVCDGNFSSRSFPLLHMCLRLVGLDPL